MSIDYSNFAFPKPKNERVKTKTEIKKKSNKLAKLERNRESIITDNFEQCYICKMTIKQKELEKHEIFGGSNRKLSMIYKLVIPLCDKCHKEVKNNKKLNQYLHDLGRKTFENYYKTQDFLKVFGKNYLDI